jgi:23S rRNA (adenine2503-C2)-methyltransferase
MRICASFGGDMTHREPISLLGLSSEELVSFLSKHNQPAFRANQIRHWIFEQGELDPARMVNLPMDLRNLLSTELKESCLTISAEQASSDGTLKRLYALPDGQQIEAVMMPYRDKRRTACISSQVGCAMGCTFCATGQMGFARQLSEGEIFEQAARYAILLKRRGERLSNVVFMGMGEPFHNYDNVMAAIRRISGDLGIGARHITVSTVGLVPQIRAFADEGFQVTLAVSLHSTSDAIRGAMMPINRRYPLSELLDACRYYVEKTHRRVTFEWALIVGENDSPEAAHQLGRRLKGLLCHVNLIPLNPTGGFAGRPTDVGAANAFVTVLSSYGLSATLRVRRGLDIDAGCGQLKAKAQSSRT